MNKLHLPQKLFIAILFILFLSPFNLMAINLNNPENLSNTSSEGKLVSLSGYVKDAKTGESLIGATVYVQEIKRAASTNQYGFYSISVLPGTYTFNFSYVGYETTNKKMELKEKNNVLNIELGDEAKQIDEVVVKADKSNEKIKRAEMSVTKLEMKSIRKIPALMGEIDVLKVIQMLPGVLPTSEGTSGFSVRGGGIDQNLILLDEATVYNASHLMGFFSVFNNDAINDVKLYKGDIPAYYGGRLSSVLDVRMKEGNNKKLAVTGGIGLISSRLTLEGPILNEKTSFLISGRRTYADLFFPLSTDESVKKSTMYFYDLNLKVNHQFNDNNRLFLSAYLGRDIFGQKDLASAGFGNKTATLRWNHQFSGKLFSNLTAIASNYDYALKMEQGGSKSFWNSKLTDYSLKADFNYYPNPENEIKFGATTTYHAIDPCDAWIEADSTQSFPNQKNYELEHAFYASNQEKIGEKFTLKYGLRFSIFQNIGKSTLMHYNQNHTFTYSEKIPWNSIFNTYQRIEPRLGANYTLNDVSSIKASYSRTVQYMQLASNSNGGMPLDYWFPSSPNIKPQVSDQYALGYVRNLFDNNIEFSVEGFYKKMDNVIDFTDHAVLLFNDRLEGDIRIGKAQSYGLEFLIRRNEGKLNGWISYTLSKATRKISGINDGKEYNAPYDKPNNINIILNYEFTPRITLSANWIYATGTPITFPIGSYQLGNEKVPIYSDRNAYRMRDYHRLDLSLSIKGKDSPNKLWHGEWVFSLYNAYGRHNDWMLNFDLKEGKTTRTYLPFVFFPGITYNFNF